MKETVNENPGEWFCSGVLEDERIDTLRKNPRAEFIEAIRTNDVATCLVKTSEIHGHYCPGSALGVMACVYGLNLLGEDCINANGIMENLLAIVEINACFTDGIQTVSGCTLGNNALIYRDLGKHAVTFAIRGKKEGVRVQVRPEFREYINDAVPEFYPLLEKVIIQRNGTPEEEIQFREKGREAAFALTKIPFHELFRAETVVPDIPGYAPVTESAICTECGEMVMATKIRKDGRHKGKCFMCSGNYSEVEGGGIVDKGPRNEDD